MIIGALDQRKEVFNGANLVIGVQLFSRLHEYGGRSPHELRKSRATTAIPIPRRVVHQDLSQLLNSGIAGLTLLPKSLKELSHRQVLRRRWWRKVSRLLVVTSSVSFSFGSLRRP